MMKQYVLLDWDGNIAKTLDVWMEACQIVLQKRGINLPDKVVAESFGKVTSKFPDWGVTDLDDALSEMDAEAYARMPDVELYPDALFVLDTLQAEGKKMALISTSLRANFIRVLDKYDIHHYFDVVMGWEDSTEHKPHAEPLEKALEKLGGTKDQAIMIGDTDNDIEAAHAAGIDSILFYPPEHDKFYSIEKFASLKPTHMVDDFRQVLDIVR